jgi:hypothetical protein
MYIHQQINYPLNALDENYVSYKKLGSRKRGKISQRVQLDFSLFNLLKLEFIK